MISEGYEIFWCHFRLQLLVWYCFLRRFSQFIVVMDVRYKKSWVSLLSWLIIICYSIFNNKNYHLYLVIFYNDSDICLCYTIISFLLISIIKEKNTPKLKKRKDTNFLDVFFVHFWQKNGGSLKTSMTFVVFFETCIFLCIFAHVIFKHYC